MEESEQIDGTLLAQSAKREGVFTVEGRRLVESSRNAVNPEIERVMRYGFDLVCHWRVCSTLVCS
jgi:hypothetical protein